MPAARTTDMHVCPMVTGIIPHVGGPILPPCAVNVLTGSLPQARVSDMAVCVGPPDVIALGSFTVLVGGLPAARMGDMTAHGGAIVLGWFTVLIGDAGAVGGVAGGAVDPLSMADIAILQAQGEAIKMLTAAIEKLDRGDPATMAKLGKWFGTADDATRQMMLDRARKVLSHIATMRSGNFVPAEPGQADCYAYVYPNDDSKMYLGDDFNSAPTTGADSKAGTMIHETTHYQTVAGTDDEKLADGTTAYGHAGAQQLAQESPDKAKNTADSFEYFVEDQ